MKLKKLNLMNLNEVNFMEKLYLDSFPKEEQRPTERMFKAYENSQNKFSILLAVTESKNVGFFNFWDFDKFIFAEHFAISSDFRSGGYGSRVMKVFMENISKPIVLEVEPPETEISQRRIGFYERLGFKLWDKIKYRQPSYESKGISYPMRIMSVGELDIEKDHKSVIETIHNVYSI
ncbi:GNAT family N-acetyltransferase [Apibacter raozihei]|uniref:GNAT family N-acetyltransferase n=1 Tax=Apibacter TaxID=1778601 RepID=UPI000FE35D94|nr:MULTISPECIES: GNAT family N-acetyltransferase [Apibacter]